MSSSLFCNRTDGRIEQVVSEEELQNWIISWVLYGVEGIILTITNFPIVFAVMAFPKLRQQKEYVIMAALAFADGMAGFAFLVAAIGRLTLVAKGTAFVLVTRWECYMTPWVMLFMWSQPVAAMMLMVISIDRMLAVSIPLRYFTFTNRYAFCLCGTVYLIIFVPIIWTLKDTYNIEPVHEVPAYCFADYNLTPNDNYFNQFLLVGTTASVAMYLPVLLLLKISLSKNQVVEHSIKSERLKKATIALAISSFFTFIFYIIPITFISLNVFASLDKVWCLMLNLNAMVNIFIYITRFKDIRVAIKAMFTCRSKVVWNY